MTVGLHTVNLANAWLNTLGGAAGAGTTFTAISSFAKLHTGDPGSAGTSAASANTTRVAMQWAAAASGSKAIQSTLPVWATWAAGSETISHISVWDNISAGNVMYTFALTLAKPMTNGDTLTLSAHSFALTPLMA